jgi:type II secretory pathway component PulK
MTAAHPDEVRPDPSRQRRSRGIALLIVLVIVMLLITSIYLFQRRAVLNASITHNRLAAAEADSLARGGLRLAEAVLFLTRLEDEQGFAPEGESEGDTEDLLAPLSDGSSEVWQRLGEVPIELEGGQRLQLEVEDAGARLNLNALVPQSASEDEDLSSQSDEDEAVEYLVAVLRYIIDGIEARPEDKSYDERAIARNLIDYMDADDTAIDGRSEDAYYARQDPPYHAANGPFLSFEEIGLVEGVDPVLLEAMRPYLTVHPIGGREGINLNTAPPWVLSLVYAGPSGDRELAGEQVVRDLWALRKEDKIVCDDSAADPERCTSLNEVGLGEGSIYPGTPLPAQARVFRVVASAQVGAITRRIEAIIDTRSLEGPQMLSWRRLRGRD